MRRTLLVLCVCGLVLAACGSNDDADPPFVTLGQGVAGTTVPSPGSTAAVHNPEPGTVEIADFEFWPRELTITVGEKVTWRNDDPYGHWVVSTDPDVLDSGELSQAQAYDKTFSQAGTYLYYCKIHNYMKGTVTVQ
jgi:plastocyanin